MAENEDENTSKQQNAETFSAMIDIKQKIVDGSENIEISSREDENSPANQIKIEENIKIDVDDEIAKLTERNNEENTEEIEDIVQNLILNQVCGELKPQNTNIVEVEDVVQKLILNQVCGSPNLAKLSMSAVLAKPVEAMIAKVEKSQGATPNNEENDENEILQINLDDKIKEIPKQVQEELEKEKENNNYDDKKEDLSFFNHTFQTETKKVTEAIEQPEESQIDSEPPPRQEKKTQKASKQGEIQLSSSPKRKRAKSVFGDETMPYTENDLEMAYNAFVKKGELPPFLMRDYVIDYARVHALKAAIAENYDEAAKREKIVDSIVSAFNNDQGQFDTESKLSNLEHRLQFARDTKQKTLTKYLKQIEELRENESKRMDKLVKMQNQEIEDFQFNCQNPDFLIKFSKPSLKLIQLRKQQKNLALAHDFEGAKNIKGVADRLQQIETNAARERAAESIKLKYREIIEKHEKCLRCQKLNSQRKITEKESQMRCEIDAYDKLIKQLLDKIKEAKSSTKVSNLPSLSTGRPIPLSANKKISQFRRSAGKSKLDVKIGNINKILGIYVK